jgi:hypothetical protein
VPLAPALNQAATRWYIGGTEVEDTVSIIIFESPQASVNATRKRQVHMVGFVNLFSWGIK